MYAFPTPNGVQHSMSKAHSYYESDDVQKVFHSCCTYEYWILFIPKKIEDRSNVFNRYHLTFSMCTSIYHIEEFNGQILDKSTLAPHCDILVDP